MNATWQSVAESQLGSGITSLVGLSGGDFATAYRATLAGGRQVFIKTHDNPPPGFFQTESAGLTWLRQTQTVNIPEVLAVSDSPPCLALEWVDQGSAGEQSERELGRQLAALHACRQASFGRSDEATTGSLAVPNNKLDHWHDFYATQRLLPLMERARQRNALSQLQLDSVEKIASRLTQYEVPEEPPSLLHGDLWAGNRLVDSSGRSWLIDPAAHCGHREFDLAMMALFGGYGEDCFAAYHEAFPLAKGWRDRMQLHQLAPLIVHAIKFGGRYHSAVDAVLRQYL